MITGIAEYDSEQNINGITILTSRILLFVRGQLVGAIACFRDMTEVRQLAENLTGVNRYVDALRNQPHEFNNKLHVIYGLTLNEDPVIAGFLNSKFSRTRELDVELQFHISGVLSAINDSRITYGLVTILGNLIDNSLDAVQFVDNKQIIVHITISDLWFNIEILDNGSGVLSEDTQRIFSKGYSTKGDNRGFG